jgi:hypothetical protein
MEQLLNRSHWSMIDWDIESIFLFPKISLTINPPPICQSAVYYQVRPKLMDAIRQSNDRHNTADNRRRQCAEFRREI